MRHGALGTRYARKPSAENVTISGNGFIEQVTVRAEMLTG